ncbi:MAG: membrane protein insertase YidC [Kineosporiaceae bacterium]
MSTILYPIEVAVAWIMVSWHRLLTTLGMPADSGLTWALSIVGLVVVIRIILIPLFVKQIKASRGMQLLQPELKKIQDKYKGKTDSESRQKMGQETMELYRKHGTNPFSSCLPILMQSPIFFGLFRVLNGIPRETTIGPLDKELVTQAKAAKLFGATLSDTFTGADTLATRIIALVLIIGMSFTTFTTQRQLMRKNMPPSALDSSNPMAQSQKILLYVMPIFFLISGVNFPIGVLVYWLTTNLWTMGQQFYVIKRMPAPGSPAEKALLERRARKSNGTTTAAAVQESTLPIVKSGGQRQQPRKQTKGQRKPPTAGGRRTPSDPQDE